MTGNTTSGRNPGALPWMMFLSLYAITIYFEKANFNRVFNSLTSYLVLGGCWFITMGVAIYLGKRLPLKILASLLFASTAALALLWLGTAFQIPADYPRIPCSPDMPWTCHVFNPTVDFCNAWTCQMPGKVIQLCLMFGLIPPTLTAWCQRTQPAPLSMNELGPGFLAAILILVGVGALNFVAFYWSCYCVAALWVIFGFVILRDFKLIAASEWRPEPLGTIQTPVKVNLWMGFRILILMTALAVFGVSMLENSITQFQILPLYGCGFGLFLLIAIVVSKRDGMVPANALARTIDHIELIVFSSLCVVSASYWFLVTAGIWFNGGDIMSPIIIGFVFGDVCMRVVLASMRVTTPRTRHSFSAPRLTARVLTSFTLGLALLILLGVGMIPIPPQDIAGVITYFVGFVLAALGLVTVILNVIKIQRSLCRPGITFSYQNPTNQDRDPVVFR